MNAEVVLAMSGITKQFPGVLAVDSIDLTLRRGEVLALVGENGAGKSTLIKILAGAHRPDSGQIRIGGVLHTSYGPREAIDLGVAVIYQELNYLNDLSIAENIFLGNLPRRGPLRSVDYGRLHADARVMQQKVGIRNDPSEEVARLSVAEKQLVEIARAFSRNVKVLVFDEPTSALNEAETENLFALIRAAARGGTGIIYISHRLEEIFKVSDRVQVMRDGRSVAVLDTAATDKQQIVRHMVGREITDMYPIARRSVGETVLEVSGLSSGRAADVSFHVKKGEIVGLFGLMGAGRTSIARAIYGAEARTSGEIRVGGAAAAIKSPEDAIRCGIAYIPSERKSEGLILNHSVKENITVASLRRIAGPLGLDLGAEARLAQEWVDKLRIRTPSISREVSELSGGNQQKVVLSKYLLLNPRIIIMNEPTRGIDVGAKAEIYRILEDLCEQGICALVISSEMPELMAIADRIVVVSGGRVTGQCHKRDGYNQERLLELAIERT